MMGRSATEELTVARVLGAVTAPLGRRVVGTALQQDLDDVATAAEGG